MNWQCRESVAFCSSRLFINSPKSPWYFAHFQVHFFHSAIFRSLGSNFHMPHRRAISALVPAPIFNMPTAHRPKGGRMVSACPFW